MPGRNRWEKGTWHGLSRKAALAGVMTLLALCMVPFSSRSASAISYSDYFTISYQVQLNKTQVTLGESFSATANGTALCKEPLPITVSSATITSRVVATSQATGARVVLNPSYAIVISPFPNEKGAVTQITQEIPLSFPAETQYATYTVTGELINATVQTILGPIDVTSYLPQSQPMGTVLYDAPPSSPRMEGDVNNDGVINLVDAVWVARHLVETITLTGDDFLAADVNDDNVVNLLDLVLIKRFLVGTIAQFPGGTYIP